MCGKFTQLSSWRDVVAFSAPLREGDVVVATPMAMAQIIRLDETGARESVPMRWGFARKGAPNPARPEHMHARCETIDTRPTFADSFAKRRGILLVQTFNEGEELPSGRKKQWVITPKDGKPIGVAVIYEAWVNGDERLSTFVQVTTPANALIAKITDRMLAILRPEDWPVWLGETPATLAQVKALLKPYDDGGAWEARPQAPKAGETPDLFS